MNLQEELAAAGDAVLPRTHGTSPEIGVILGSGLGDWAEGLRDLVRVPYGEIPGMPVAKVPGHAGNLCLGRLGPAPVACMQGRAHYYEGYPLARVVFGARLLARLGCKVVLITNAAGGVMQDFERGDLMLIADHINFTGTNPLVGANEKEWGPRFPDMTHAYDPQLRALARSAAVATDQTLREGVYAAMSGPSYETPAEIQMLRTMGAHAVGMSTVPEVIALRHMGVRTAGISCITNMAAGLSPEPLSHAEVEETAKLARDRFSALLSAWVERIYADLHKPSGEHHTR